jgi:hypothetical protein
LTTENKIITTDETWFHYYDPETKQQSSQWKNIDSPRPKKAKVTKSLEKNMYSPDLAPMDFAVFPYIKSFLRGTFLVSSYSVIKNLHKLISLHVKYYIHYGLS